MIKQILSMAFLATSMVCMAEGKMDNYTLSPADGSTIAAADFTSFTVTFPEVEKIEEGSFFDANFKVYIDGEQKYFGSIEKDCKLEGNTATIQIHQSYVPLKTSQVKFSFYENAFIASGLDSGSPAISVTYNVEVKQYECVVTPSNAAAIAMTDLHDLTFTFLEAKSVQLLPKDSFSGKRIHLYDRGASMSGWVSEYADYSDEEVVADGNAVKVRLHVSDPRGGQYTLVADEGAFLIDGCKSAKITVDFDLLPFDTNFDLVCADKTDAEGRLYVIASEGLKIMLASGFSDLKNEDDEWVGYADADYSSRENRAWFNITPKSSLEKLADGKYHFQCRAGAVTFTNEDGIMLDSREATIYFEIDSTSGIHNIHIDDKNAQSFTIDGRRATGRAAGIVIKNGQKNYIR